MNQPPSLQSIKANRKPIRNVNTEHEDSLSPLERFALWITKHVGTMGFFILLFLWTVTWFSWNVFGPKIYRFDAYPSFVFWLFISNMMQLFLMPLIMVGQNLDARHSESRAEADLEISIKSEREIEAILEHLEYQNDLMLKILRHLETDVDLELGRKSNKSTTSAAEESSSNSAGK
jgi:uncharacterized membrane protein